MEQPFQVWMDHNNLEYLKTVKRLASCQTRWVLLFNHFNFTLTYRAGSKNKKCDALSRVFPSARLTSDPEPILPPTFFVATISWEIEKKVSDSLIGVEVPSKCPHNHLCVLPDLRSQVIHWGHSSRFSCHPSTSIPLTVTYQGM